MSFHQPVLAALKVHVTLIIPVFLPQEASCAYVLIVTAIYWVSEAVPLGAAALVPAFLYPLFGVMKSSEVRVVYFSFLPSSGNVKYPRVTLDSWSAMSFS